jgi:hypothetical protein
MTASRCSSRKHCRHDAQADARITQVERDLAAFYALLRWYAARGGVSVPSREELAAPEYHGLRVLEGGKAS